MAKSFALLPGLLRQLVQSGASDEQLLRRFIASGDESVFAALVDRHGPMLLGVCRRWLEDAHLAEDVLQATFLDGRSLLVEERATFVLWDLSSGTRKSVWNMFDKHFLELPMDNPGEHLEHIESVTVAHDGRTMAISMVKEHAEERGDRSWFGRVLLVESATGKLLQHFDVDDEYFTHVAFSPNGKLLANAGAWTVRLWEVASGKEAADFEGHMGPIASLAFNQAGTQLASASTDSTVLIWQVPP